MGAAWLNGQETIDSIAYDWWTLLQTFNNHLHVGAPVASKIYTHAQLDSLATVILNTNNARSHRLVDQWLGGAAPCEWMLGPPGPWLPTTCTTGTQTRTTDWVPNPAGCQPAGAKPNAVVESRPCSTATALWISPADMLVVINSADPNSAGMGAAYQSAYGIPSGNVVTVNLGNAQAATAAQIDAARTIINAKGKQFSELCWANPSQGPGGESITAAITFGVRNVSSLTPSAVYNYTGTKPRTEKGFAPSFLLVSINNIRKDADGTRPTGSAYMVLANDGPTGCNVGGTGQSCTSVNCSPRGKARKGQTAPGLIVWDNTCTGVGGGDNDCNSLSGGCWLTGRKPINPVIANYGSGPSQCCDAATATRPAVIWRKGYYGDHVTSTGGNLPTGAGQKPLTWHLDRGASMSVGSVIEPWQDKSGNSPGSLVEQFVDVRLFHPLFTGGASVGVAAWSSVKCADRMLMAGDGMCAPFK